MSVLTDRKDADQYVADAFLKGERILHITAHELRMRPAFNRIVDVLADRSEVIGKTWSNQHCSIVARQGSGAGRIDFAHTRTADLRGRHFDLVVFEDVPTDPEVTVMCVIASSRMLVVRDEAAA